MNEFSRQDCVLNNGPSAGLSPSFHTYPLPFLHPPSSILHPCMLLAGSPQAPTYSIPDHMLSVRDMKMKKTYSLKGRGTFTLILGGPENGTVFDSSSLLIWAPFKPTSPRLGPQARHFRVVVRTTGWSQINWVLSLPHPLPVLRS